MLNEFAQHTDDDLNVKEALRKCVSCATIVVDQKQKISVLTPEAARLTGVPAQGSPGQTIEIFPAALQRIFEETFDSAQSISKEIDFLGATGKPSMILVNTAPVRDSNGKTTGAVAVLNDFSSVEKLEEKLAQIDRLASIGTLSVSMAHEIKNALVAVKTFVDLLVTRNPQDELSALVRREMARIDSIVSQMLTFSGPAKPNLLPIRLHDVLNHSLRLVQHQIAQKNIRLDRSFAAATDVVKGDDYQLKQAFLNLLFNAVEATPTNGTLTVFTEEAGSKADALHENGATEIRVIIRDSGLGISSENLTRVFEPFFTTKPKGTGLGLPITRRIVHEHNGTIAVESEPDKGATFSIVFPIFRKSSQAQ
ncbi:MAG: ATP-binding protein [Verrucomicrobiota bacterium]